MSVLGQRTADDADFGTPRRAIQRESRITCASYVTVDLLDVAQRDSPRHSIDKSCQGEPVVEEDVVITEHVTEHVPKQGLA